ncbi:DUF6300 family protein [Nonomuraea zeae]|uniref:Uncharacterized protein n=1 Tax=Nonomuraea zeae TaxID=1642303 RepID=A0A5S4FD69_9ACTN|nr:DUF6300 family protein [Nonomuraea zeae]TMR15487.1 hypothetical protein ETD85_56100 [Nonomuraea zeae]
MSVAPACPRCRAGEVLAVLRLPHTWANASGGPVRGMSEIVVCARCDAGDPLTGPIVAYFAAHDQVRPESLDQLARPLRRWLDRARPPEPDEQALEAEIEAWYRGDL